MAAKKAKGTKKAAKKAAGKPAKTMHKAAKRAPKSAKKALKAAKRAPPKAEKAEGDLPVRAYIGSLRGWQRDAAQRFDAIVAREVPHVRRAVKWSAAFYGVPGQGWFAAVKGFSKHVKVTFFRGTSLKPVPPAGASDEGRSIDIRETDSFDEEKMASWARQAAALPGWGNT